MNFLHVAMAFCSVSFIAYGTSCLSTQRMVEEFKRYRLSRYRDLTGRLQLLGAAGLLIGFVSPLIGGLAAGGLSLQMACGLGVRVRLRDPWLQCVPAALYMLLCGWIATQLL
ncbi:MAG: DoxX family protein [Opitutales bacterium]